MPGFFTTRGIVISVMDLNFKEWPELAAESGLTTIGIHPYPANPLSDTLRAMESDDGREFLDKCRRLGLSVEYEIHAMEHLLPRSLFEKDPTLFRMDENGVRNADINLCPGSERALQIIAENAVDLCSRLKPTTGRYFLWGSDAYGWCRCPGCRELSESDQALIVENYMLKAIRTIDPDARLAHLAYSGTGPAPGVVKPLDGIFLEFAPVHRRHDIPYAEQHGWEEDISRLDENLDVFDRASAQILEYWLDVSLFSNYKRPVEKLPWRPQVFAADIDTYGGRGVRNITSFACFIDKDYVSMYGRPPVAEYGAMLRGWRR